jgi:redox-sensitive bicupin YhaK (pirin superfamily)
MRIRRSHERGLTEIGWLTSRHSFSFGDYFDPKFVAFRSLRVINDDWVAPGKGFGMHGHRDMEILTLVLEGALEHQDSLGHREVLRPGEVQVMSAGSGIRHSEYNPSVDHSAHFLQIWIEPHTKGIQPRYEQREFPLAACNDSWLLLAGSTAEAKAEGCFEIFQNARVSFGAVGEG